MDKSVENMRKGGLSIVESSTKRKKKNTIKVQWIINKNATTYENARLTEQSP